MATLTPSYYNKATDAAKKYITLVSSNDYALTALVVLPIAIIAGYYCYKR